MIASMKTYDLYWIVCVWPSAFYRLKKYSLTAKVSGSCVTLAVSRCSWGDASKAAKPVFSSIALTNTGGIHLSYCFFDGRNIQPRDLFDSSCMQPYNKSICKESD